MTFIYHFNRVLACCAFLLLSSLVQAQEKPLNLRWNPREDINILMPSSIRVYETNGQLHDSASVRAFYAIVDLRDKNLIPKAAGSNELRETTFETYVNSNAILAINGGYFSGKRSESLLVCDGKLIAPGPSNFTRGAFGLVNRKPQIVWPHTIDSTGVILQLDQPTSIRENPTALQSKQSKQWQPSQALGAGPVLVKNGKIYDASKSEGFSGSHLMRHPRTAIGYRDTHTLILVVVDGRQTSSVGVTISELAQLMAELGCFEAVNLDGGGSSAMVAAHEVVNVPVDKPKGNRNSLRKNASAFVLTTKKSEDNNTVLLLDTDSKYYSEKGTWSDIDHVNYYGSTPSREALANQTNKVVYDFDLAKPDSFQVAAWWTVDDANTPQATFIMHHQTKVDTLVVDQTTPTATGRWNLLGNYYLNPDDYLEVTGNDNRKLVVDAIRLVSLPVPSNRSGRKKRTAH